MDASDDAQVHILVVTGPARDRLYERFARLFYGRSDVRVVKDRRVGERRRDEHVQWRAARGASGGERRSGDRRRRRPDWLVPAD